jgi:hypothetical protein
MSEVILYSVKRVLYKNGMYVCAIPTEQTHAWTVSDWINYIDNNGTWVQ